MQRRSSSGYQQSCGRRPNGFNFPLVPFFQLSRCKKIFRSHFGFVFVFVHDSHAQPPRFNSCGLTVRLKMTKQILQNRETLLVSKTRVFP
jgi:hypothetical protein